MHVTLRLAAALAALLPACASPEPAPAPPAPPPVAAPDPDADQLAALGIPGPGEGRPHRLLHELSFPSPEGADAAAIELSARGLSARATGEGEQWLVLAEESLPLSVQAAATRRAAMEALAQGYGGVYEGFRAELLP